MAQPCAASVLEWVPETLYNSAITAVVVSYSKHRKELRCLTENIQFDVYYKLYTQGRLCQLGMEFCELDIFAKVLTVSDKRHLLHHCFQALMDHGVKVATVLAESFKSHCAQILCSQRTQLDKAIQLGFSLGGFLTEAGWYPQAEKATEACLTLCSQTEEIKYLRKALECCIRLVYVRNANCKYQSSEETYRRALRTADKLMARNSVVNLAAVHGEMCALLYARSQYDEAHKHCLEALKSLHSGMPVKSSIDILRQSSKACVAKRRFKKAEILITHAVQLAREYFGVRHPKYSDALLDYGFYLLNVDSICQSVTVYQQALDIRLSVFGGRNIHVAVAHEDLAYASYVHQYSSGKFDDAKMHAERAIEIITHILPEDHLLLASSKRVKALILEEIAIDSHDKVREAKLLQEAQDLHLSSLSLAKKAFGEFNVQTAKHYGNLGRLYQSMHRYKEAELMHIKAIEIKERLLGEEDYEVALSVGHLASLYNYDMMRYTEAESLYLRSIQIGKKLFGPGYSGLEYDYRGLIRLYSNLNLYDKVYEFQEILTNWMTLREINRNPDDILEYITNSRADESIEEVLKKFFKLE
ncbi:amyloid protein-binding protein 2-like [Anneissia japonica]|uniref:amyloid protein-binding protein 2-like n=1 Tax=Anneissia japonica TaxID=1529436 RepID=UPI0014255947|nr:amyloid protein-binding protein 2-like [Anneissia japonica]